MGLLPGNTTSLEVQSSFWSVRFAIPLGKKSQQDVPGAWEVAGWGGQTVALESPPLRAIIYFYAWVKFNKREHVGNTHARWIPVSVSVTARGTCFTMLTESNGTMHSRKIRWGMGGGRQGHREKDVKGNRRGILFEKLILMNQHQPRWMHVHVMHKKETPKRARCFECRGKPGHPVCYYERFIGKKEEETQ